MKKFLLTLLLIIFACCFVGCQCEHTWTTPTCTAASKCTQCGISEGAPANHIWIDATCTSARKCSQCNKTEGSPLNHTWIGATCSTPKECSRCGKTEGNALGHTWIEATCTSPKTCSQCGAIGSQVLSHKWSNATCLSPKTCYTCGATSGSVIDHKWSSSGICTMCGKKNTAPASVISSIVESLKLLNKHVGDEVSLMKEYAEPIATIEILVGSYTKYTYPSAIKNFADSLQELYTVDIAIIDLAISDCGDYSDLQTCKAELREIRKLYVSISNETLCMDGMENNIDRYTKILNHMETIIGILNNLS